LNLAARVEPVAPAPVSPWEQIDLSGTLPQAMARVAAEVEKRKIEQAVREAGDNRQAAADALQISYRTLVQKLKEYGIAET
jgi:DNA-binding NtrC family response regulator